MTTITSGLAPRYDRAEVVVPAPGNGPGHWADAPSALLGAARSGLRIGCDCA